MDPHSPLLPPLSAEAAVEPEPDPEPATPRDGFWAAKAGVKAGRMGRGMCCGKHGENSTQAMYKSWSDTGMCIQNVQ